jgi:hypothetical protein
VGIPHEEPLHSHPGHPHHRGSRSHGITRNGAPAARGPGHGEDAHQHHRGTRHRGNAPRPHRPPIHRRANAGGVQPLPCCRGASPRSGGRGEGDSPSMPSMEANPPPPEFRLRCRNHPDLR